MPISYSIIVPAYNEEKLLPRTLIAVKDVMDSIDMAGEVIVVDNNSDDETVNIARHYGARIVHEPVNQISRARNAGARVSTGKYLIFLDADTVITSGLLRKALANLECGECCGGGVLVKGDKALPKTMQRMLELWNFLSLKFGLAAGCFIYCLREGFEAIGGFNEKVYVSEEIWFSRKLTSWGNKRNLKFQIITSPIIVTSTRKLDWYSPGKLIWHSLPVLIFPPAIFFRRLCSPWYRRPDNISHKPQATSHKPQATSHKPQVKSEK